MLFHEFYGAYYNAMAHILSIAVKRPIQKAEILDIIKQHAFGESAIVIEAALAEEKWHLLFPDGTTPLMEKPHMPMTLLEKQWLKAILTDPRIQLFVPDVDRYLGHLEDVDALFTPQDYVLFDQYTDGDPYTEEAYIRIFRTILDALKSSYPLKLSIANRYGKPRHVYVLPQYLEYSAKDNKFRLIAADGDRGKIINVGRIMSCERYEGDNLHFDKAYIPEKETVSLRLTDSRNTLERALLHFAHFEKQVHEVSAHEYILDLEYDTSDESEMVIRILSFGPTIQVVGPLAFQEKVKNKLQSQMKHMMT